MITRDPVETQVVVPARPLELAPVQRQAIHRTIVREPAPPVVDYRVGTRVPAGATLYGVPQEVAVEVPAVGNHIHMRVNGRVVLVDRSTGEVVADFGDCRARVRVSRNCIGGRRVVAGPFFTCGD